MIAGLSSFFAAGRVGWSRPPRNMADFYIVSVGFSDTLEWHHSVLEVRQDGSDVLVRYIRVVPASTFCGKATKILTTATRLPNTSLRMVTSGLNPCAIDERTLNGTIRAFPRIAAGSGDRFAIVTTCGKDERVIRLPFDYLVDLSGMKRKRPRIAALWALERMVGTRAFGPFATYDIVPAELAAQLQPASEAILAELKSGRFDTGLASRSFKDDVQALRPDAPEASIKLANASLFRFERYVPPTYPALAKQARISGVVELEITSNPTTGGTEQVTVISGHPILAQAATAAAQKWRFSPGAETALRNTRVVLDFVSSCP